MKLEFLGEAQIEFLREGQYIEKGETDKALSSLEKAKASNPKDLAGIDSAINSITSFLLSFVGFSERQLI